MYQEKWTSGNEIHVIGKGNNGLSRVVGANGEKKFEGGYDACEAWLRSRACRPVGETAAIDMSKPVLYRYADAKEIRNASAEELAASIEAAEHDGGSGVITVDGVDCYVQE